MKNSCKKHLTPELLFEKRFVFAGSDLEAAPEAPEKASEHKESLGEKYEKAKGLDKPEKIEGFKATMKKLADKFDSSQATTLERQFKTEFDKQPMLSSGKPISFDAFWKMLKENKATIRIIKEDGEWIFRIDKEDGTPLEAVDLKANPGVKIDQPANKDEKEPEKKDELAVEVDEKKIQQKEELKKTAEEAEKARGVYWDRGTGLVTFKGSAAEKWKQTQSVTLNTLFPHATEGAQLMVTDKYSKKPKVATLKGGKWKFDNGQIAKIFDGYKVREMEGATIPKERQPQRPQIPNGYALLDTKAQKLTEEERKGTWTPVAKVVMKDHPEIEEHGYTSKTYAAELKKFATDEGHYWVILPPKTKTKQKKEADQAIKKEREAAEKRTKEGKRKEQIRINDQYDKAKDKLWNNEKFAPDEKIRDLASDEKQWEKEWAEGDLLNVARIKQAFRLKPFNKIPETKIRDGLREVMYYWGPEKNGITLENLVNVFSRYAELYKPITQKGILTNTPHGLMQADRELIHDVQEQGKENMKEGKPATDGMDEEEVYAWNWGREKLKEMGQLGVAAVEIIKAVSEFKPATETRRFHDETMEKLKYTDVEKHAIHENRKYIYGKTGNPEMYQLPEEMDEILNDFKQWEEMWESEKGGFGRLKMALQAYPYGKIPLSVYKYKVFNMLGDDDKVVEGSNEIGLENILSELNGEGQIYKNLDGKPGDIDDFINEYWQADLAHRYPNLDSDEMERYKEIENPQEYKAIYYTLSELWKSTAVLIQAVRNLDPESNQLSSYKGEEVLKSIFPPTDTGSLNGEEQNYEDMNEKWGTTISGGLFDFDHEDADAKLSKLDKYSSAATAFRIISDNCNGDLKKIQSELNRLLHVGIVGLIAEPNSPERTKNLELLGFGTEIAQDDKDMVKKIAQKLEIKDLDTAQEVSRLQRELIRLGFILEATNSQGEVKEAVAEKIEWSTDPYVRELQKHAHEQGANPEEIKAIEPAVESKMTALFDAQLGRNLNLADKTKPSPLDVVGLTIPVKIAGGEKGSLYLAFGAEYRPNEAAVALRAGIGGSVEIAQNVSLVGGVMGKAGGGPMGPVAGVAAGLGVAWEIPVDPDNEWEPTATLGFMAGASINGGVFGGPAAAVIWHKNIEKEYQNTLKEHLKEGVYKNVEKAKNDAEMAQALRQLPPPHGIAFTQLQVNMKWSDQQLVKAYKLYFRKTVEEQVAKNDTISPFELTHIGFGAGVIFSEGEDGVDWSIVPGIAFGFAIGSEYKVFQRPMYSTQALATNAEAKMAKQADARIRSQVDTMAKKAGYSKGSIQVLSDDLVGTTETGMQPTKTERSKANLESANATVDSEIEKLFQDYQKELLKRGLKLTKVPAEKMYKLEIQQAGNWQLYIDPAMQEKTGIILKNGEIFISASKNPNLAIKRVDYYFPRKKDGNIKHSIITISDQDYRTQEAIMNESDFYIDSRTQDQTERKRFPAAIERKTRGKTTQQNMLAWQPNVEYTHLDNLEKDTPETAKARKEREKFNRMAAAGQKLREQIGEADIEGVNLNDMRKRAQAFEQKHRREYRLLTTNPHKKPGDIKKIFDMISEENPDLNGNPDKIHAIMEEMFNLSMADEKARYEKLPEKQRKLAMKQIVKERLRWMETMIYIPFFKEHSTPQNNPDNIPAGELAEAFLKPIRDAALENPEEIPIGARLDVAVGTQSVYGRRGFNIAQGKGEKIPDHRIFVAKDYASALETGQPPIDKTIALIIRDAESPTEFPDQSQFLASSLATKLALMGTAEKNPTLGLALGEDNFNKIIECYATKPPQVVAGAEGAIKEFQELVKKLRSAQEGQTGTVVVIDGQAFHTIEVNGVRLGIRTGSIKSGVYERCLNASKLYDEKLIALSDSEPYQLVGNMRVYGAKTTSSLVTSFRTQDISIGFGVTAPVGPEFDEGSGGGGGGGGEEESTSAEDESGGKETVGDNQADDAQGGDQGGPTAPPETPPEQEAPPSEGGGF